MYQKELLQDLKGMSGVPVFGLIIIVSFLLGEKSLAAQLFAGIVIAYAVTILIRVLYFRQRPDMEKYHSFIQKIDASSFPSLHSMRAGVLGTVLALHFSNPLLSALFVLCSVAVAASRVLLKRHFVSDVVAGLVIGVIIGFAVARLISFW
jgi:undecaprenyl-diphosphatase